MPCLACLWSMRLHSCQAVARFVAARSHRIHPLPLRPGPGSCSKSSWHLCDNGRFYSLDLASRRLPPGRGCVHPVCQTHGPAQAEFFEPLCCCLCGQLRRSDRRGPCTESTPTPRQWQRPFPDDAASDPVCQTHDPVQAEMLESCCSYGLLAAGAGGPGTAVPVLDRGHAPPPGNRMRLQGHLACQTQDPVQVEILAPRSCCS